MSITSVNSVSPIFAAQAEAMRPCHDLMGGTSAMRCAATRYIEKGQGESKEAYDSRLSRTMLLNVFRRTANFLRGQVFSKPVIIDDGGGASLGKEEISRFQQWSEDVDKRGSDITSWSSEVFRCGLRDGVVFAVVDHSTVETRKVNGVTEYKKADGTWARKSKDADTHEGWSPYLVVVEVGQVLNAWGRFENGRYVTEHFRYMETVTESDGEWGQKSVQQIRVFRRDDAGRVLWEIYRNDSDGKAAFRRVSGGLLSLAEIPVAVFMPGDAATEWTAEPALIDLAWLNIRHWQVSSGHAEMMEYVQRPVWFASGMDMKDEQGNTIQFGAGKLLCSPLPASLVSVGVDPSSYTSSSAELQKLEQAMAMYGLQLLQPKQVTITATEAARDAEENNSTLMDWALTCKDFLENCLRFVGAWWELTDGPSVTVNTDFAKAVDVRLLLDMQRGGSLSTKTLLSIAKGMGLLPDDLVVEEELASIAQNVGMSGPTTKTATTLNDVLGKVGGLSGGA